MPLLARQKNEYDEDYDRAALALSIGAIVGIVIAVLGTIVFCVAACCIYRRVQKKRSERQNQMNNYQMNTYAQAPNPGAAPQENKTGYQYPVGGGAPYGQQHTGYGPTAPPAYGS